MLDDRWKLLAIGKTAECDLKSEAWAAIPLRCIPCNSSRWSEWWFLDTSRGKQKRKKSPRPRRKFWSGGAILGCEETSTSLLRCIGCTSQKSLNGKYVAFQLNVFPQITKYISTTKMYISNSGWFAMRPSRVDWDALVAPSIQVKNSLWCHSTHCAYHWPTKNKLHISWI